MEATAPLQGRRSQDITIPEQPPVVVSPPPPTPPPLIGIVTMVCHTLVLIAVVFAIVLMADAHQLNAGFGALSAIGGITGGGLVINGRKYQNN